MDWTMFIMGFLFGIIFIYFVLLICSKWEDKNQYTIKFDVVGNEYVLIDRDSWDILGNQIVFRDEDYNKVEEHILYLREKKKGLPKQFRK